MKQRYSLVLAFIIYTLSVGAQQTTFQAAYSFGSFNIPILTDIIQNPAGQYVMTGTDGTIPILGAVTVIDSGANVVWSKEYTAGTFETEIVDVKNVSSGGYIVAGATDNGLFLSRLDVNGNVTWSNTYHVASGTSEDPSRVLPTSDGGFVVAGYVYGATPPGGYAKQDSANCYMFKVNSSGTLLWAKVVFCSVNYINDHLLNDVAEAVDGYVFVGSMSQAHSDDYGTYGLVIKTDFNGNVTYIKHWGATSTSSTEQDIEATSITSITTAPGTSQVIGGDDNSYATIATFNSTAGTATGYQYGNGFLPVNANYNAVPTFDGNYAMIGMSVGLSFESYVLKVNSSTGAVIWGEGYTGGFASLLPEGRQVADSGFIMVTTALGTGGYEYLLVKTNSSGQANPSGCTSAVFNPAKATYSPALIAFTPDSLVSTTVGTMTLVGIVVHPADSINCIKVVCTAPAVPSATASPATVCPSGSSTISGGAGVTYNVYTAATGGTLLGAAPLAVNPTATTTYYIEASSGTGCVSNSRQALTITVTPGPGAVGSITGSTTPCVGAQAYSIATVSNATTYTWAVSGGGTISGGQGSASATVTWSAAGNYTLSVVASNSCGSVTGSESITVGGVPGTATASALPNPACARQNVALSVTSTGSTTWAWSGPNTFSSTLQSPSITGIQVNGAGTYTVTASNTCGSVSATVNLVVNSSPTNASATANPNPACQSQTVTLTGAAIGASTWSWTGPNTYTSSAQSPQLSNVQANQSGLYTLIAGNTCGNDTATVTLVVNTAPAAVTDSASPNPVCAGSTLKLSGSSTGATGYSWSGPNGFTASTLQATVTNFQNANAGVYTLSATNACGTTSATVTVNVATAPTGVTASVDSISTCYGSNLRFTGAATGATSYGWTGPNGITSNQQNFSITGSTVADSGAYVFTATNACGSTTSTVVVNVDTLIHDFLAVSGSGDTLCSDYQLALLGQGININTWQWTGPNGFSSSQQDTTVINATLVNSGQYILTGANACGSLSDTINIYIENGSVLSLTASSSAVNDSACYGATINLFATDSFDTYVWTGPNGFSSTQQNPVITNAGVAQSGVYGVTATNHCGQRADSVHVYIDTIPQGLQLSTTGNNNTSCQGQSITITAASAGINNWLWTGPAGFTSTQASFTISNIQPNQQGNYIVTATNSCGSKTDTIQVTVFVLPDSLFVSSSADSICPGQSVVLSARSGLTNVIWSDSLTGSSINATQPGLYFYTGQDANGCAVYSDSLNVYNAAPPVLNLFGSNPTSVCQGQQTVVLHASSDPTVGITWSPGGSHTDSLVVTAPGEYSVIATKNGCTASDSVDVALAIVPTISFTNTVINTCCINVDVTPVVTGTIASYQWSDTTTGPSDLLTNSGVYTVTITSDKGCFATGSVTFNKVCILAQATASPDSIEVEGGSQLNVATGFAGHFIYQWSPLDSISDGAIANPIVTPHQSTLYTVVVIDTASGCTDTSAVNVYVNYLANYAIPNVFAPNGNDQLNNNTFHIINEGDMVTVTEMSIFDRWGEAVYESGRDKTMCTTPTSGTQPTYCWDGKYNGKLQPMGNYVYTVKVTINATGAVKTLNGNLALIW